jgi:hypothetical protein
MLPALLLDVPPPMGLRGVYATYLGPAIERRAYRHATRMSMHMMQDVYARHATGMCLQLHIKQLEQEVRLKVQVLVLTFTFTFTFIFTVAVTITSTSTFTFTFTGTITVTVTITLRWGLPT